MIICTYTTHTRIHAECSKNHMTMNLKNNEVFNFFFVYGQDNVVVL